MKFVYLKKKQQITGFEGSFERGFPKASDQWLNHKKENGTSKVISVLSDRM